MLIGANSPVAARPVAERAAPAAAAAPESATEDAATDPLAMLDDFVKSAALSRKAFAEDRLKHLKEQMNTLALFNLAPGFLSGHTARMARELEGAAKDFAGSVKSLAGLDAAPFSPQAEAQANSASAASQSALPPAYLDVLDDDAPSGFRLDADDYETATSFMAAAHQLRSVVEMIADDRNDRPGQRRNADDARQSTSRVADIMTRLDGASAFDRFGW